MLVRRVVLIGVIFGIPITANAMNPKHDDDYDLIWRKKIAITTQPRRGVDKQLHEKTYTLKVSCCFGFICEGRTDPFEWKLTLNYKSTKIITEKDALETRKF